MRARVLAGYVIRIEATPRNKRVKWSTVDAHPVMISIG
jgi:hypothetical protein